MLKPIVKRAFMDLGMQYEILVYERERLRTLDGLRAAAELGKRTSGEYLQRLDARILKLETVLNHLVELKDICE